MSQPASLGFLALIFPSLRRALERKDKLELDVVRLNKLLKSKEEQVLSLVDTIDNTAQKNTDYHNRNFELERMHLDLEAQIKQLEENPLLRLKELPDNKDTCYVWLLSKERDCVEFYRELCNSYYEQLKREPQAMHLVLHNVEDIAMFSKEQVKTKLKTWLRSE